MSAIVRNTLSTLTVFGLAWAGSIFYWRSSGATPSGMEMLTYLGLVPAGVLGGGWALRSLGQRALDRAGQALESDASAGQDAAPVPAKDAAASAAPATRVLGVLAADAWLPPAREPAALLGQLPAPPRPGLHPHFRDRDGLPVYAAHVADLDPAVSPLSVDEHDVLPPAHARALVLLEPVLENVLPPTVAALPVLETVEERVVAGWRQQSSQQVEQVLAIDLLVPLDWPAELRDRAQDWLQARVVDHGLDARRFAVNVIPAADANATWRYLQQAAQLAGAPAWRLLLACASAIDPVVIEQWQQRGRLWDRLHPDGRVPGEAAAGVLLTSTPATDGVCLHPARMQEVPAPAALAQCARATSQLASDALTAAAVEPARVDLVISDADQRGGVAAEAYGAASSACPDLDTSLQCLAFAATSGETGPVAPLAMLALAQAHLAAGTDAATLLLGVDQGPARWAAVVALSTLPPADSDSASAAVA
ncbi:hypothetical protein [Xanthomonas maliensis]|uniref:hypothetical protein n=1 Tax=Xanthomonas maliensis TaxID=1321368 RepID=UPI0003B5B1D3|nr:hypothetical protein [Xanthomonas maliensis]KAB7769655.1 hypothetical protein CKY51_05775 [Xanthomonas maliensis]